MWTDVVDLRDFYATSLGQVAARMLRRRIRLMWPDLTGQRLLGLGYAIPYLRPFLDEAERVIAVMAAEQGVLPWPASGANRVALADESDLPLPDLAVDRVLLVHAVECSEQLRAMLREVWRVLGRRRAHSRGGAQPARHLGAARPHAVRLRPPLYGDATLAPVARLHVHAGLGGGRAVRAAEQFAHGFDGGAGLGKSRRPLVPALFRRRHDRSDQADLCAPAPLAARGERARRPISRRAAATARLLQKSISAERRPDGR